MLSTQKDTKIYCTISAVETTTVILTLLFFVTFFSIDARNKVKGAKTKVANTVGGGCNIKDARSNFMPKYDMQYDLTNLGSVITEEESVEGVR